MCLQPFITITHKHENSRTILQTNMVIQMHSINDQLVHHTIHQTNIIKKVNLLVFRYCFNLCLTNGTSYHHMQQPSQMEEQTQNARQWNDWTRGYNFFKVYQNLVTTSPFFVFFIQFFLPCKIIFMDDHDGIQNCNSLKYNISEKFDNF